MPRRQLKRCECDACAVNAQSALTVDRHLARWAHMWAAAAFETYRTIEADLSPESIGAEIARRDAMTMVLVDAVRNVVRGAELALGVDSDAVRRFNKEHPDIRELRNRFEHYEEYVMGTGLGQRAGRKYRGASLELDTAGIDVVASEGGGPEGHLVRVVVRERGDDDGMTEVTYEAPSRKIAVAACRLARELVSAANMLDECHLQACKLCADPEGI